MNNSSTKAVDQFDCDNKNSNTSSNESTVISNVLETTSNVGPVVISNSNPDINTNKPWREIIKRKLYNGRSDN